jgi:hypothetical protein
MVNKELVSHVLSYLEKIGWSEIICDRWKDDIVKDIKDYYNNIDEKTLEYILNIVLFK